MRGRRSGLRGLAATCYAEGTLWLGDDVRSIAAVLALSVAGPAVAQEEAWPARFERARAQLLAGDFADAAAAFAALETSAPGPADAAVAQALGALATEWAARRVALVPASEVGESGLAAKAANRRTTSELAELYIAAVLYGVGTGAWIAVQTKPDTVALGVLPALALGGAAAGGVVWADASGPLGYGVPQTLVTGLVLGLEEGILWTAWNQSFVRSENEWSPEAMTTVVWGASTLGAAAGGLLGTLHGTTPGRAAFVGSAGTWAAAFTGLSTAALLGGLDRGDDYALLAAALGLNVGAAAGWLAAEPVSPTVGRVRFLDLGGISGALLGGGLYVSLAGDDDFEPRALAGSAAVGIGAGLTTAWFLTAGMEADRLENAALTVAPTPEGGAMATLAGAF